MFVVALLLCVTAVARADDTSITVDVPLVCTTVGSAEQVVKYYLEGGFDLVHVWVDEYSAECFKMDKTPVPRETTKKLVVLISTTQMDYGYIPVSFWGQDYYLFFIRIKTPSIPA